MLLCGLNCSNHDAYPSAQLNVNHDCSKIEYYEMIFQQNTESNFSIIEIINEPTREIHMFSLNIYQRELVCVLYLPCQRLLLSLTGTSHEEPEE